MSYSSASLSLRSKTSDRNVVLHFLRFVCVSNHAPKSQVCIFTSQIGFSFKKPGSCQFGELRQEHSTAHAARRQAAVGHGMCMRMLMACNYVKPLRMVTCAPLRGSRGSGTLAALAKTRRPGAGGRPGRPAATRREASAACVEERQTQKGGVLGWGGGMNAIRLVGHKSVISDGETDDLLARMRSGFHICVASEPSAPMWTADTPGEVCWLECRQSGDLSAGLRAGVPRRAAGHGRSNLVCDIRGGVWPSGSRTLW